VFSIPAIGCVFDVNYYDTLMSQTIMPVILFAVVAITSYITSVYARRINRSNPFMTSEQAASTVIMSAFLLSYYFLSDTSIIIFQVFICQQFDGSGSYLIADYSISCDTSMYNEYKAYGIFCTLIYPIGIPLTYTLILCYYRKKINPSWRLVVDEKERAIVSVKAVQKEKLKVRRTYKELEQISMLYDAYKPRRWYFEIFDCARRLSLGAIPVFIFRGSVMQVIIIMLVSLASVGILHQFEPYISTSDNQLALVAQWSITLVLFSCLIIQVMVNSPQYSPLHLILFSLF
jgi:hypothetical protein